MTFAARTVGPEPATGDDSPLDLAGSTLGTLGLGKLGSQVATIADAFGMEVQA